MDKDTRLTDALVPQIDNPELKAIRQVLAVIDSLNVGEKSRVLYYCRMVVLDECGCHREGRLE